MDASPSKRGTGIRFLEDRRQGFHREDYETSSMLSIIQLFRYAEDTGRNTTVGACPASTSRRTGGEGEVVEKPPGC